MGGHEGPARSVFHKHIYSCPWQASAQILADAFIGWGFPHHVSLPPLLACLGGDVLTQSLLRIGPAAGGWAA